MQHVKGIFETREAADLATEHLVQEYGFDRSDIFLQPAGSANSEGTRPSGGDSAAGAPGTGARDDGATASAIELTIDVEDDRAQQVREILSQAGGSLGR